MCVCVGGGGEKSKGSDEKAVTQKIAVIKE